MTKPTRRLALALALLLLAVVTFAVVVVTTTATAAEPQQAFGAQSQTGDDSNVALFREAESMFYSAQQPDSIPLFSRLIARLEVAGDPALLEPEERELLTRSLYYRSIAYFNFGDEGPAEADLRRLVGAAPTFEIERDRVSPKYAERFDAVRGSMVGTLMLSVSPPDARAILGDRELADLYAPIVALAGFHELTVERPGHTPFRQQVRVTAGETLSQEITLERVSAVLSVVTRPAGAEVRLDGVSLGVTAGTAPRTLALRGEAAQYPASEFSDRLMVEGLDLGSHRLEVLLDGYRTVALDVRIDDLVDLDTEAMVLEPLQGTIFLVGVPDEATVAIDGAPVRTRPAGDARPGARSIALPPGEYPVTVTKPGGGVFEEIVEVADRSEVVVTIDLRPSIALVGVLGDDDVGAERLADSLSMSLGGLDRWAYLDRAGRAADAVAASGLDVEALRALTDRASPADGSVDWQRVQAEMGARVGSSVYLLAVLSDDLMATHADLWTWPAAPGPALPDRVRVALDDPESLQRFVDGLQRPFARERPWFGAILADSDASQGPIVVHVSEGSPAAAAGLQAGDEVTFLGRDNADSAVALRATIEALAPGESREMILNRNGQSVRTNVEFGSTPAVIPGGVRTQSYAAVWAASRGALSSAEPTIEHWVARLNIANVLMQAGMWDDAVRELRSIDVPADAAFAQAMVDYLLGNALEAVGPQYLERAREAYSRAAAVPDARLWHRDGPLLVPRATARLATLGGEAQ